VQAKTAEAMLQLRADAEALAEAGAGAIVLEGVPREVAAAVTAIWLFRRLGLARAGVRLQILVLHDILNMTFAPHAKLCGSMRMFGGDSRCGGTVSRGCGASRFSDG